jgi:hypothetical protein
MALFEDENRKFLWGFGLGLAAAVLLREVFPAFKGVGRPLAKATVKSGMVMLERSKETVAHWGEVFEDLVVEAKAELEQEARTTAEAPAAVPTPAPSDIKPN